MYWTHLIFALVLCLINCTEPITAVKPGYLDFDNLPETNFSCKNKVIGGYYADVETGCQMFHVCTIGQKGEVTDIKFLCLNGTVFDQETRVCERIDEVDCSKSEDFFNLNLELYGNHAGGIQPEEEFFCEDCSTEEDDYDLSSEITTRQSSTTTTTTTTTTTRPTTTTTTTQPTTIVTAPAKVQYTTSDSETIAALLALHNAFSHSVQNQPTQQTSKVKPPPPRVINNAFASVAPSTSKPSSYYPRPQVTQLPPRIENTYSEGDRRAPAPQEHRDQLRHYGHGTLQLPSSAKERHKTNYYQVTTPPNLNSNYHHFQNGDSGFVHSFEPGKQYNYQYYQPRKLPEEPNKARASVSIVTSTSTSTSIRASKPNVTVLEDLTGPEEDFPTAYDDYPDDAVDEAFFRDVPKLRTKRSHSSREPRYPNHRYPDESRKEGSTSRYSNHRYEETTIPPFLPKEEEPTLREEFLQNLLGSLDMEEHDRQKMVQLFKSEEKEMKQPSGTLKELGNKLGELIMDDINKTIHLAKMEEKNATGEVLDLEKMDEVWRNHYAEMSQEVDLKFDLGSERDRRDAVKNDELAKALAQDYELTKPYTDTASSPEPRIETRLRGKRQAVGIDTEKFAANHERRIRVRERPTVRQPASTSPRTNPVAIKDVVPVVEDVDEGDFTTRPYIKPTARTQGPRLTTRSAENAPSRAHFNYETTTRGAVILRRRKLNGRSSLPRERTTLASIQQPVLNFTRDVTKLKDTPVYEDSADSKEYENTQVIRHQHSSINQNTEQQFYGQDVTLSVPTYDNSNRKLTTEMPLFSTQLTPVRSRRPVNRNRGPNVSSGEQNTADGVVRVSQRGRPTPRPNIRSQISAQVQHPGLRVEPEVDSPTTTTQWKLKGLNDYTTSTTEKSIQVQVEVPKHRNTYRGSVRGTLRSTTPPNEPPPAPPISPDLVPDPNFICDDKIKGGFYADLSNDCKGFFICSQGAINGPLLKTHFWCGTNTKFNQRSRTCQAEDLVECSVSERYYHLNQDFAIPETEEQLRPAFEPKRVQG